MRYRIVTSRMRIKHRQDVENVKSGKNVQSVRYYCTVYFISVDGWYTVNNVGEGVANSS